MFSCFGTPAPKLPTCEGCQQVYDVDDRCPRVLPCGSIRCTQCLLSNIGLACAECDAVHPIDAARGGVLDFPQHMGLLDAVQDTRSATTPTGAPQLPRCPCHGVPATVQCQECNEVMCGKTGALHLKLKVRVFRI
jgi:hypothetical protein